MNNNQCPKGWKNAFLEPRGTKLYPDEVEVSYEYYIGLYEGDTRCTLYDSGTAILTSNRILWVSGILKERLFSESNIPNDAIWLELSHITRVEKQNRFLKSSPKIILYSKFKESQNIHDSSKQSTKNLHLELTCYVCGYLSRSIPSDLPHPCPQCGVHLEYSDQQNQTTLIKSNKSQTSWTCTICEHVNLSSESSSKCALCGVISELKFVPSQQDDSTLSQDVVTKLAFRGSGMDSFFSKLQKILERRSTSQNTALVDYSQPSKTIAGLGSIIRDLDAQKIHVKDQISDSLKDLNSLMNSATEMIKLIKKICDQAVNTINSKDQSEEANIIQSFLQQLGMVENPVTEELLGHSQSTNSTYHLELAKELERIIESIITKTNQASPFISLSDLYCYWNRARGSSLLSPKDVIDAASTLPKIKSTYRMTKMPAGSLVITDLSFNTRIIGIIQQTVSNLPPWKNITAQELARLQKLSTILAKEQLALAEQKGIICRDQGPIQMFYYGNPFISINK